MSQKEEKNQKTELSVDGAGGIILNEGKADHIVLVRNKKNNWSFPKGHVEEGEDLLEATIREIYEEAGIEQLNLLHKLGEIKRKKEKHSLNQIMIEHKTIHLYLFETTEMSLDPVDPAIMEAKWIHKNEVERFLHHREDKIFFTNIKDQL